MSADLKTRYLGLDLRGPLVAGAGPLTYDLDSVRRLEDAGAAAVVLPSLFEEQIEQAESFVTEHLDAHEEAFPEATGFWPDAEPFALGPDDYLERLRRIRDILEIPVIASLNGSTPGGWLEYARLLQEAGADAIELNLYAAPTADDAPSSEVEERALSVVREVASSVEIPIAVKLSPFYTSFGRLARSMDEAGANGLVLFNRFYQPDLDVEALEARSTLELSTPTELRLRLRWVAQLSGRIGASLAVTGGVHTGLDVVKSIAAGADCVQVVSALLVRGIEHVAVLERELVDWMDEHEYASLDRLRGSLDLSRVPNPGDFERAQYLRVLHDPDLRHRTGT